MLQLSPLIQTLYAFKLLDIFALVNIEDFYILLCVLCVLLGIQKAFFQT